MLAKRGANDKRATYDPDLLERSNEMREREGKRE